MKTINRLLSLLLILCMLATLGALTASAEEGTADQETIQNEIDKKTTCPQENGVGTDQTETGAELLPDDTETMYVPDGMDYSGSHDVLGQDEADVQTEENTEKADNHESIDSMYNVDDNTSVCGESVSEQESGVEAETDVELDSSEGIEASGLSEGTPPSEGELQTAKEEEDEAAAEEPEIVEIHSLGEYIRAVAELNAEFGIGDERIEVTQYAGHVDDPYLTRRLIVVTDCKPTDYLGAVRVLHYQDEYVLQFETEAGTKLAFEELQKTGEHHLVIRDLMVEEIPDLGGGASLSAKMLNTGSEECLSWGVAAMGLDQLQRKLTASDIVPNAVKVAVIDSGVTMSNPYLQGRVLPGYNILEASSDVADYVQHGTHVAGIIVDATGDNVMVLPVKVFNSQGKAPMLAVKNGIQYALSQGASVLNLSLSGIGPDETYLESVFQTAINAGAVVCVAAGNEGENVSNYYPSNSDKVLTIAALEQNGNQMSRPSYSNYGSAIDFAMPGSDIYSTMDNGLEYCSGTSMACPHAAAAVAMLKSFDSSMGFYKIKDTLINYCDNQLIVGRESSPIGTWDGSYGYGCTYLGDYIPGDDPYEPHDPEPPVLFEDVKDPGMYFYTPVYWAAERGITTGKTATTFAPYDPCTRAQIVTFIWKAVGQPKPSMLNVFVDVEHNDYFYKPVLWAKERGITSGKTETTFEPYSPCTRGQIVTFLWILLGRPEPHIDNPFRDVKSNDYYYNAVLWAAEHGITSGTSTDAFSPWKTCTRAQAMTFLYKAVGE